MDLSYDNQDDIHMVANLVQTEQKGDQQKSHPQSLAHDHTSPQTHDDTHMAMDTSSAPQAAMAHESENSSSNMDVDMEIANSEPEQVPSHQLPSSNTPVTADSPMEQAPSTKATGAPEMSMKDETLVKEDTSVIEETSTKEETADDRLDAALKSNDEKTGGYESSDLESSDDDDENGPASSDSDSDSDSDNDIGKAHGGMTNEQRQKTRKVIDAMDDDGSDNEGDTNTVLHTEHEILQPKVTKPDVVLGPDSKFAAIGIVISIVDNVVVVQGNRPGNVQVLDSGTVVAIEAVDESDERMQYQVLGEIFETFGPVSDPLYSIRFNTAAEIPERCKIRKNVYYVTGYQTFVFTQALKKLKGSDASNRYDEEVDDDELEFSDDQKEMEHKRILKQNQKKKKGGKGSKNANTNKSQASQDVVESRPVARTRIALPQRPVVGVADDDNEYEILQRPGVIRPPASQGGMSAGAGTVPWYQQQQRALQQMMGSSQQQSSELRQQQQVQQQQLLQQQLLQQKQQQQQLFQQQQQQQAMYQKQIQEAQETIRRLQQQQSSLQNSALSGADAGSGSVPTQDFQFRAPQQLDPSFSIQQAQYQSQPMQQHQQHQQQHQDQQQQQQQQSQTISSLLTPLFSQQQNPDQGSAPQ